MRDVRSHGREFQVSYHRRVKAIRQLCIVFAYLEQMLLKLAFVLEKNFDYFLLDTPYAKCDSIIDNEIAAKLKKCNVTTLITVGKLIDVLIDQQEMIKKAELD